MGKKKVSAFRSKASQKASLPDIERWSVIGDKGHINEGKLVYLQSPLGINQEEAERLARKLENAKAVPSNSLDKFGKYSEKLHAKWERDLEEIGEE